MASRRTTRFAAAISVAALALSLTGGAVFAGEITGNGKSLKQDDGTLHARSHCAFSGQNDDPSEEFPFGGRVQSYDPRRDVPEYAPGSQPEQISV